MADPSENTVEADPTHPGPGFEPTESRTGRVGLSTVMASIALVGLLVALAGTLWAVRPVRTPLQDCGSAAAFLIDGRVDVRADPADPPEGLTSDDVIRNNEEPCQERAAERVLTGGVAATLGLFVVAASALTESIVRGGWRWRRSSGRAG